MEATAGKLSPFSYADGVRRANHPLNTLRESHPDLVALFEEPQQLASLLLPPEGLTGDSCVELIMKHVNRIEALADAARSASNIQLYHSLTYVSDAFIPLLLLAQSSKNSIMPEEHIRDSWPSIDKNVMHEGRLPALLHLVFQCCFWSDNSKKNIPIVHILTKGVPKRCQVRSLIDIIDKKQQEDRSLMNFILDIFNCFALGGYQHSAVRPVFEMRKRLYSNLIFDNKAKNNIRTLYMHSEDKQSQSEPSRGKKKQKNVYVNAGVVTLAVREYLCTCVRFIPSLYKVLVERCDWANFENNVFANADRARTLMNENFSAGYYWFRNMDAAIHTKKSNKDSSIYQPTKNAFVSTLLSSMTAIETDHLCSKEYSAAANKFLHEQLDPGVRDLMLSALKLYSSDVHLAFTEVLPTTVAEAAKFIEHYRFPLSSFGCSTESVAALRQAQERYGHEERAKFIHQLATQLWKKPIDFALTSFILRQLELRNSVRLQPLPFHYLYYQYTAILNRYKLPDDTTLTDVMERYGKISVCMQCKTVRSFVVTPESNRKSFSFYAHGNDRVVVDHVSLKIYCTGKKRDDKTNTVSSASAVTKGLSSVMKGDNFNPLDIEKAFKKEQKRKLKKEGELQQSQLCRQTEIKTFSILGKMFDFFGKSYVLCCYCARVTEYSGRRFYDDAFVCGCCMQDMETLPINCSMCNKRERKKGSFATYREVISDTGGGADERITIHLCPAHNKDWIAAEYQQHAVKPLRMSRIIQGYNEGWESVTTASGRSVTVNQKRRRK